MEQNNTYTSAPQTSTLKGVKDWLIARGACGIMSNTVVADIVGVSKRTVYNATRDGKLPTIDKCTYAIDDVAKWLFANQRYISQAGAVAINEELYSHVKAMLLRFGQPLIKLYNNDVQELVSEIAFRLSKRRITSAVSLSTVIYREIQNFSNCKTTRQRRVTLPLHSGTLSERDRTNDDED